MEESYERDILGKGSDERLRSTQKRKLMKRLSRIKLNTSLENISAFYAAKVKKLKLNNISLAKELSEQRQVSRSWYDTVVSLKEELQYSQESLLRLHYQAKGNEDYERVVQEAVERRVRAIVEPLEECVSDSLRNAYRLVNNLTEVKQLVTSAHSFSDKEQLNFSDMSPVSLFGSRPHLGQNSKSPRKNVIHPIVEGHVFHQLTKVIPKMSVEESERYCLQEQTQIGMGVIGEQSEIKSTSDVDSETLDYENRYEENENYYMKNAISNDTTDNDSIDDELNIVSGESPLPLNPEAFALGDNRFSSGSENSVRAKLDTESSEESFKDETLRSEKAEKADQLCEENVFEGSSWMYLIKSRPKNTKKSETKTCKTNIGMRRLCCILPDTSSESEGEHVEIPAKNVNHRRVKGISKYGHSGSKLCKPSVSHLDTGNCSTLSTRDSNGTEDLNNQNDESFLVAPPSFIINDSQNHFALLNEESDLEKSPEGEKYENLTTWENKHSTSSSTNLEFNLESVENLTYVLDSPMDITECFKEEVIRDLPPLTEECDGNTEAASNFMLKEGEISKTGNDQNSLNTRMSENMTENLELPKISVQESKKANKYFKLTQENGTNEVGPKVQIDSRIYDLSLMDASQITPCLTNAWYENENVPSNINASPEDSGKKIEDHSIVAESITKAPSPTFDVGPDVPFHTFPNSCNLINTVTRSKSNRTRNENNKCKSKRKRNTKPSKKKSMKPKNMNFSEDRDMSIFSSPCETEDEDVWTPYKKPKKRKNKYSIKNITCAKKLKLQTNETTKESTPLTDLPLAFSGIHQNYEINPMLKANDININSNANDIGLNSNANDIDINSNANNIGRNSNANDMCLNSNANDMGLNSNANDMDLNSNANDIDINSNANDFSVKMNITVEPPLCEIPKDMSTLVAASADIIMKHIKKEIKYIASRDACKVPKLDSKHESDHPIRREEIELFKKEEEEEEKEEEEEEEEELFNGEEMELFNGRPRRRKRRTTLKIQSFKEPSLNTKMRSSLGRKPKRIKEKKGMKK
ncbi:UNVERIFIED_CONTAM: hypothetical protein RMT77_012551 [Armadillidium vulgare]